MLLTVWAILASAWALIVSFMLIRNPLPVPDRGHRAFGLPSEEARSTVLKVFREFGFSERFTFDAGPTRQTLLSDGFTVLNHLSQPATRRLAPNAISIPVSDPGAAAQIAAHLLQASNYSATFQEISDVDLPQNRLVVLESNAFDSWVLVFRRHIFKMPKVKRYKLS